MAEMSPTMWAVILTYADGMVQASQCFPVDTAQEAQDHARLTYKEWKDALIRKDCDNLC